MKQPAHYLQVPVDNGSFALMQAGNSLAGVTEYLQNFILCEACLETLVHQIHHLASWDRTEQGKGY